MAPIVEVEVEEGGLNMMLTAVIASASAAFCMCVGVVVYLRRSGTPGKGKVTEITISEYSGSNSLFRRSSADESALSNIAGKKISMQAVDSSRVQESHPGGEFLAQFHVSGDVVHADGRAGGPATGDSSDLTGQDSSEIEERLFEADMEEEEPVLRPISKMYSPELMAGSVGRFGTGMKPKLPVFRPAASETRTSLVWNAPGPSGRRAPISLTSDLIVLSPHGNEADDVVLDECEPDMPQVAESLEPRVRQFEGKVGALQVTFEDVDGELSDMGYVSPAAANGDDLVGAAQAGAATRARGVAPEDEGEDKAAAAEAETGIDVNKHREKKRSFFSAPSIFQRKKSYVQDQAHEAPSVGAAPNVQTRALKNESAPAPVDPAPGDDDGKDAGTSGNDKGNDSIPGASGGIVCDDERVSAELVVLNDPANEMEAGAEQAMPRIAQDTSEAKQQEMDKVEHTGQDLVLPSLAGKMEEGFEEEAEPGKDSSVAVLVAREGAGEPRIAQVLFAYCLS